MLISDTPCYECLKRYEGCHSNCDDYKKFREKLEVEKQLKKDARKSMNRFYSPVGK